MEVHSVRNMNIDNERPAGGPKPTVKSMLSEIMRALKPDVQLDHEAKLWFEELEAKQRETEAEMLEEMHKSYYEPGGQI